MRYALLMQTAELLTRDGKRLLTGMKESRLQGRQEMRGKHRDMWQFIIDKVDDILIDYFIDPEDILIEYKRVYIYHADPGADIKFNCYACEKFFDNGCNNCIIGKKIGCCSYDDSAFQSFLAAIRNRDRKEFIRQARRIKNAWN